MTIKFITGVLLAFTISLAFFTCKCKNGSGHGGNKDSIRVTGIEKDSMTYRHDQVVLVFKHQPTEQEINTIKQAYLNEGLTDSIHIKKCADCDGTVQLWEATNIETFISTEGVKAGSSGSSRGAGEDSLAKYSLNYINSAPVEVTVTRRNVEVTRKDTVTGLNKDTVVIAVLDTGIDTAFISSKYLWRNPAESGNGADDDGNCLVDDERGWNFVSNTSSVRDDNINIHGTLVSQYIINEFSSSPSNFVQIMALKTHDQDGRADLFNSICALHYAINKGAKIINASWGFYNYHTDPLPYLDSLITSILPAHGMLFFAAAGNKIRENDSLANELYKLGHGGADIPDTTMLRNLAINNFYPACLSRQNNNVITVTTTDELKVSPTQNFSDIYADLAVRADSFTADHMYFRQPFRTVSFPGNNYISGSSFATPIAAGKFGASFKLNMYISGVKKSDFFNHPPAAAVIFTSPQLSNAGLIRRGKYSRHTP